MGILECLADGPGSHEGPFSGSLRVGYTEAAMATWHPYIDNVTKQEAQSKNMIAYGTP